MHSRAASPAREAADSMTLRLTRLAIVLALSGGYFAWVFQLRQGAWLTSGLSNWMDPYFINGLLEHWYYSFRHLTDPASPPMFFPARGTLGYSHGLLLYGPIYAVLRPWTHPFVANTLTFLVVMETGALSLYVVLRRYLALGFLEALLLAAFFCTSRNVVNGSTEGWAQLISIYFVPSILLLGLWSAGRPRRRAGMVATGLLAVLLFAQEFYTALFTSSIVALVLAGARLIHGPVPMGVRCAVIPAGPRPTYSRARRIAAYVALGAAVIGAGWALTAVQGSVLGVRFDSHHHHWERPGAVAVAALVVFVLLRGGIRTRLRLSWLGLPADVWAFGAGALVGLAIFLHIYLRAAREHPAFPAWQLMNSLFPLDPSSWRQLLDPTLIRRAMPYEDARAWVVIAAIALVAWWPRAPVSRAVRRGSLGFVGLTAIVVLVALRVNGVSPWQVTLAWLPGFSAIRDPKRIIFPFELAATLWAAWCLASWPRRSWRRVGLAALVAGLLAVDWNPKTFAYERPAALFDRYVAAPIAIDPTCRSFLVARASDGYRDRRPDAYWLLYSIDALFIAAKTGVPTLNGFSAWTPNGWWEAALADPESPDYVAGAARWIRDHGLRDVCILDLDARTMTKLR